MTQSLIIHLPDTTATGQLGLELGRSLSPGSILFLEGDLGSGKTTLVQGIGQGLGITDAIVSPTFALIHEYPEGRIPLYHLDLYRLTPSEVATLSLETYWDGLENPLGIVAIEWPDRLPYRPSHYLHLHLHQVEDHRELHVHPDHWNAPLPPCLTDRSSIPYNTLIPPLYEAASN